MVPITQWKRPGIARFLLHPGMGLVVIDASDAQVSGFDSRVIAADATRQTANKLEIFLIALTRLTLPKFAHAISN